MEPHDGSVVAQLLCEIAFRLSADLGDVAIVTRRRSRDGLHTFTDVVPRRAGAATVSWDEDGYEVVLSVARGGRWELAHTEDDVRVLEEIVEAVVAGRAQQTTAPSRACVRVALAERTSKSSVSDGCHTLLLPLPFWTYWGRTEHYAPYRSP